MPPGRGWMGWRQNERRGPRYNNNNNPYHNNQNHWRNNNNWSNRPGPMDYMEVDFEDRRMYSRKGERRNNGYPDEVEDIRDYITARRGKETYDMFSYPKRHRMDYVNNLERSSPLWEQALGNFGSSKVNDRLSRSKSVPRSLEREISLPSRCDTPARSFYRKEDRKEDSSTRRKPETSKSRYETDDEEEFKERIPRKTSETEKIASLFWGSPKSQFSETELSVSERVETSKRNSPPGKRSPVLHSKETNAEDFHSRQASHTMRNTELANSPPGANKKTRTPFINKDTEPKATSSPKVLKAFDGSPVGEDGVQKCVVFRCIYCYAICADKETAEKHVRSEIHYNNYVKKIMEVEQIHEKNHKRTVGCESK